MVRFIISTTAAVAVGVSGIIAGAAAGMWVEEMYGMFWASIGITGTFGVATGAAMIWLTGYAVGFDRPHRVIFSLLKD